MNQNPQTAVWVAVAVAELDISVLMRMYNKYNKPYNAYIYVMDV